MGVSGIIVALKALYAHLCAGVTGSKGTLSLLLPFGQSIASRFKECDLLCLEYGCSEQRRRFSHFHVGTRPMLPAHSFRLSERTTELHES